MSVVFQANVTASRRPYEREASDTYPIAGLSIGTGMRYHRSGWRA
jgi:hypothetical protein